MSETDEREALARLIDPRLGMTCGGPTFLAKMKDREAFDAADRILSAGFHRGPRIPAEGTPEEAEAVEMMAREITGENGANCCHLGGWKYAEAQTRVSPIGGPAQRYGGDRCECRLYALAAIRALRGDDR